jgi:DNA-binding transcriptional ArsR family regulator
MRLEDIITSEARIKILVELFSETNKDLYVRELTRRVGTEINAVRRELKRLTDAGLIKKEKRGNRLYYLLRREYPFYYELLSMVSKEVGIGKLILSNASKLGKLKLALLSAEYAEGREAEKQQLDLLIIGEVDFKAVEEIVQQTRMKTSRDVNFTILTETEFISLKNRRELFLLSFLVSPNILLVGDPIKYLSL